MSDRIFGGIGVLIAAFFIWQATQIQVSFISDPVGPKTFPLIIGVMLGVCSLIFILRPDPRPDWPTAGRLFEVFVSAAVLIAYAMALPEFGFLISTFFAAAFLAWRLGASPIAAILAGLAISIGIFVIFHLILGLSLARGPFGW